jgi:hypothetical protein
MALNLIRRKASGKKDSLRVRRKVASWNDQGNRVKEFVTNG